MEISPLIKFITYQLNQASSIALKIDKDNQVDNLHDFRVAIRKSRCLLKLFFKKDKKLERTLKKLVRQTNSLRELDIFLLSFSKEAYPSLYESMVIARDNYFHTVWTDEFIKDSINKLNDISNTLLETPCKYTDDELIHLSHKHYKKSKKLFSNIKPKDSSEKLHKIRIHIKKSRYALDFLTKANLSDESNKILKCKQAQDYFGKIQDTSNQIDWLNHFCEESDMDECETLIDNRQKELKDLKSL